ncbi:hypothetical protein P3378_24665, partial [Vibrio parahaemolyticus]|nr:hypothetical protein [Vibrio parahaemolyticus]
KHSVDSTLHMAASIHDPETNQYSYAHHIMHYELGPDLLERSAGKPKIKDAAPRPCHSSRPWANKSVSSVPLSSNLESVGGGGGHDSRQYFEFECSNRFGHILTYSTFKFSAI